MRGRFERGRDPPRPERTGPATHGRGPLQGPLQDADHGAAAGCGGQPGEAAGRTRRRNRSKHLRNGAVRHARRTPGAPAVRPRSRCLDRHAGTLAPEMRNVALRRGHEHGAQQPDSDRPWSWRSGRDRQRTDRQVPDRMAPQTHARLRLRGLLLHRCTLGRHHPQGGHGPAHGVRHRVLPGLPHRVASPPRNW